MSAAILSTPPPQYISVSATTRGRNMTPISPTCRAAHYSTPPRFSADSSSAPSYDSPMLTPSPLRRQPFFAPPVDDPEQDDIFLQSPFKSPPPVHRLCPPRVHKQPLPINDDEGSIFLSPSTSPFFPPPTSQPLRTPVKEELRSKTRSALKSRQPNIQSEAALTSAVTSAAVGTKRKSSAQSGGFSTPLRQSVSTPLSISAANADPASGISFHRLAPLPALRFGTRTPQSKAETEAYLKGQAETMKRLRIRDMENSDEDWGVIEDDDSACEAEERNNVGAKKHFSNKLFLSRRSKNQLRSPRKPLTIKAVPQKGSAFDEVTEAISPGGHILKRRARSRPVSLELLESVNQTPSPPASSQPDISSPKHRRTSKSPPVAFPSVNWNRKSVVPSVPPPSASDSSIPRRRLTGSSGPHPFLQTNAHNNAPRPSTTRLASTSSASLFFGPSIPQTATKSRLRTASNAVASPVDKLRVDAHTLVSNRHSYAGPGNEAVTRLPWRSALNIPSPDSSPVSLLHGSHNVADDEDDMFFEPCGPPETSFVFSVTEGTPSPRSKKGKNMLPLKYKPRDSGVALSDDEDASHRGTSLSAMPHDDFRRDDAVDVDAFILRTLASGGKPSAEESKKPPGTPVKKLKNTYLGGNRPWQSAVAAKVGFNFGGLDLGAAPAGSDEDEDEENSPSTRKEANKYDGLGLGRPPVPYGAAGPVERTRWLMRRSSSGAFSSGSDTSLATPTRRNKDWPIHPRVPMQISATTMPQLHIPSEKPGSRSSSNSSVITLNSPTAHATSRIWFDFTTPPYLAPPPTCPTRGPRHRLRLREEVDVLQHLRRAATADGGQHPNVLAYIDSWEEDEALFIRTELCELGNFARFLWEYGKGLRFVHESGVIHLDLKPANIFLTQEGRFKIGDFGMASLWPRASGGSPLGVSLGGFEREGDKVYLAREVLQGTYGKAADIFSFGMTMLETATNIVVPDQGDGWHRLRQEDFSQVDLVGSPELFELIKSMMRTDPAERADIQMVHSHPVVRRVRLAMERMYAEAKATGTSLFAASPLASVPGTLLDEILGRRATVARYNDDFAMDLSP
ncbi:hypothetical protein J3R82DRAFT_10265 [Butyriboletus roseoflavus]|nr:hypothetical protein J3R82DRAFT_10265 [Butyriboletus roseoflavus]